MGTSRLDIELLKRLEFQLGDDGLRAADFLRTAAQLASTEQDMYPRLADVIAYCLREALTVIPAEQNLTQNSDWKEATEQVIDAKMRYVLAVGLPGNDSDMALDELLGKISVLEQFRNQIKGTRGRRLQSFIGNLTGSAAAEEVVQRYEILLEQANSGVHHGISFDEAQELFDKCTAVIQQIFMNPIVRYQQLDILLASEMASAERIDQVKQLISSANHIRYMVPNLSSINWLAPLTEKGMFDLPRDEEPWIGIAVVKRFGNPHPDTIAAWLDRKYDAVGDNNPSHAWWIARAALDLGAPGLNLIYRILNDYSDSRAIYGLCALAADKTEMSSEMCEKFAEKLLDEDCCRANDGFLDEFLRRFSSGVNVGNFEHRFQIVCSKINLMSSRDSFDSWLEYSRSGSIADSTPYHRSDYSSILVSTLIDVVREALRQLISIEDVLASLNDLPPAFYSRIKTWTLSSASSVNPSLLITDIASAILERYPSGDDARLIDRVIEQSESSKYVSQWSDSLGTPPEIVEVGRALSSDVVPKEWLRARWWIAILPDEVTEGWTGAAAVLEASYGAISREALVTPTLPEVRHGQSPITAELLLSLELSKATSMISSWRPSQSEWLVSARELARTIEVVVERSPDIWLSSPLVTATQLLHPTYIHHYLLACAKACRGNSLSPSELLDLVELVRTHPWDVETLGSNTFDFDSDWWGTEHASVQLIKSMAEADIGFEDRNESVWAILKSEVMNRSEISGISDSSGDPMGSAINRPCTQALETVFYFMAYEFRHGESVRPEALELLEDVLNLDGFDGAQHRAILAPRLGFLKRVAPTWFDKQLNLLFGKAAPGDLGKQTFELALKWGQPQEWLLVKYRNRVRNAVILGDDRALTHMLIAMLQSLHGYSILDCVNILAPKPKLLSSAGEGLGRLLRVDDALDSHVDIAVEFWKVVIDRNNSLNLFGFGWFAEIASLDGSVWAELTLKTLKCTRGQIDWSNKIAERLLEMPPTITNLSIMYLLVTGGKDNFGYYLVSEVAPKLFNLSRGLENSPEYELLRNALVERDLV